MVNIPLSPSEDDTDVGSTSSGSWHLWVKVFMTVPSVARWGEKKKGEKGRFWGASGMGTHYSLRSPLTNGELNPAGVVAAAVRELCGSRVVPASPGEDFGVPRFGGEQGREGAPTFSACTSIWLLEVVTMMSSGAKSLTSTVN